MSDDIHEAILLFQNCRTLQGWYGPVGSWGPRVVQTLWRLYGDGEIGFQTYRSKKKRGAHRAGHPSHDIRVNRKYINHLPKSEKLGGLSLVLVHEGVHAALDFPKLYEEMAARRLAIRYYRELSGPGVLNEAADLPITNSRHARIVRLRPSAFPVYEKMSKYLGKEQLVDYVLSRKAYRRRLTAQWIIDNLAHWGGLRNRWPETKGRYIRVLARRYDTRNARAIIEIMESVARRTDWDEMMGKTGRLGAVQTVMEGSLHDRSLSDRIAALQRRWDVALVE